MKIVMGKESEEICKEECQSIFDILHQASLAGQQVFPGWKPVNFSYLCNMSAQQKALGFGGAAKVKKYICHIVRAIQKISQNQMMMVLCAVSSQKKKQIPLGSVIAILLHHRNRLKDTNTYLMK